MPADSDRMHLPFSTSRFYLFKSAVKACELTFRLAFDWPVLILHLFIKQTRTAELIGVTISEAITQISISRNCTN